MAFSVCLSEDMQAIRREIAIIVASLRLLLQIIVRSYFLDTMISTILAPKVNILFGIVSCRLTLWDRNMGCLLYYAYSPRIPEVSVSEISWIVLCKLVISRRPVFTGGMAHAFPRWRAGLSRRGSSRLVPHNNLSAPRASRICLDFAKIH